MYLILDFENHGLVKKCMVFLVKVILIFPEIVKRYQAAILRGF